MNSSKQNDKSPMAVGLCRYTNAFGSIAMNSTLHLDFHHYQAKRLDSVFRGLRLNMPGHFLVPEGGEV